MNIESEILTYLKFGMPCGTSRTAVIFTLCISFFLTTAVIAQTTRDTSDITIGEQMPEYPGGIDSLAKEIASRVVYPQSCIDSNIQGIVKVRIVVTETGNVSDIKAIGVVHPALKLAAEEATKGIGKFKPGMQNGRPVKVPITIPVNFSLIDTSKYTADNTNPKFSGGDVALQRWLQNNIHYPKDAIAEKIEGRVLVRVIVNDDGSIANPEIKLGVSPSIDNEALSVVYRLPKFIPAMQQGKPVRSYLTVPVVFDIKADSLQRHSFSNKIKVVYNPHYIRGNEPFNLIFYCIKNANNFVRYGIDIKIPYDFKIIKGPNTSTILLFENDKKTEKTIWAYTLVANKTGELLIPPWSFRLDNDEVYSSDSCLIHVYDERISPKDSVERQKNLTDSYGNSIQRLKSNLFTSNTQHKTDGIHFNNSDSVYTAKVDESMDILYSFSIVNMPKFRIEMKPFPDLPNIEKVDTRISFHSSSSTSFASASSNNQTTNYVESIKDFIITIKPKKKGRVIIPPISFLINEKPYYSPRMKIIVH